VATADLDAALDGAERILLDSSALIAFHSRLERAHPLAEHLLGRIADSDDPVHGYYSFVSAIEILVRPIRSGQDRFTFMHTFLSEFPNLTGLPLDMVVAVQAANLRAVAGLALPDAVVVASGLLAGCEAIVTNDERWKRRGETLFRDFRWIYLEEYC
jgi:predicted nucleic acid-binding protein